MESATFCCTTVSYEWAIKVVIIMIIAYLNVMAYSSLVLNCILLRILQISFTSHSLIMNARIKRTWYTILLMGKESQEEF